MSDDEKTALLKALQANLQEKGCWTAEWLSASGMPCPPVREEELARLKEAKEELAETVRASETKKEELAALRIELDEMTKRRGAILVAVREEEQKLTTKESELLKLLCQNVNKVLERNYALKNIWADDNYFNARSMDVYITKLRKHLKKDPSVEIINVHGKGYKLIL